MYCDVFMRKEIKYLLSDRQYETLMLAIKDDLVPDLYANSIIRNIYYDTPDFRLIRRSLEKPVYKEKLRLRSYGAVTENSVVYAELKKKYKGVVYKRRISCIEADGRQWLSGGKQPSNTQIANEINYFLTCHAPLQPAVFLSYEREAYSGENGIRITFDRNILWRNDRLRLTEHIGGNPILPAGTVLMELKIPNAFPVTFAHLLSENRIFEVSFSKYGRAYAAMSKQQKNAVPVSARIQNQGVLSYV